MSKPIQVEKNGYKGIVYKNDQNEYHRLDGPAVEYSNGTKHWAQNGQRHRLDGPAVIWDTGQEEYYIKGEGFLKEEYYHHPDVLKFKQMQEAKAMLGIK